jgi:acyl-CoA thioesterase
VDGTPWRIAAPAARSRYGAWVRPRFPLPAERAWHTAALAFLADYHSHMSVARWLGSFAEPRFYTSLDQSLWLHRDLAWDTGGTSRPRAWSRTAAADSPAARSTRGTGASSRRWRRSS